MRLLILTANVDCLGENDVPIGNAFRRHGWEVVFGEVTGIGWDNYRYFIRGVLSHVDGEPHHLGSAAQGVRGTYFFDECQLVWNNSLGGPPSIARDVWQILWVVSQHTSFVNSVEGTLFLETKHALGHFVPKENRCVAYASNDFSLLLERYRQNPDMCWVAKPPNGYCGQNVFLLPPDGPNVRTILQCLTGNANAQSLFGGLAERDSLVTQTPTVYGLGGFKAEYAILQHFIPEVKQGEKRVVVACGQAIAWHGRAAASDDHRSNIAQGAKPTAVDLDSAEIALAELIGRRLMEHRVNFVGIDMAYPYIVEINLTNPGGLYDAKLATGIDRSDQVAQLIISRFQNP
ncbi:RimK family alpha-L-glutamate ligase [Bradyrhizobium sp. CCBAU 51765]|uniref:RimK family alpha-L-glutamate ligase n=1 Tax=Bradyrhizobium sp. CCBAU 51765 TaxID=1325102 RepID=UPI00188978A2|nr:RimK family alpha-L-glutamate ligase [Bradyrhizobium sp. CCBAU 51765]QOZ13503.1 RimK family alpha-L-glutamate ligase [Bradyrhizobium sp. CCBAU 51765]